MPDRSLCMAVDIKRWSSAVDSLLADDAMPGSPPDPIRFFFQPHRNVLLHIVLLQRGDSQLDDLVLHVLVHFC